KGQAVVVLPTAGTVCLQGSLRQPDEVGDRHGNLLVLQGEDDRSALRRDLGVQAVRKRAGLRRGGQRGKNGKGDDGQRLLHKASQPLSTAVPVRRVRRTPWHCAHVRAMER